MLVEAPRRGVVEEVGGVLDEAGQAPLRLTPDHRQVELRRRAVDRVGAERQVPHAQHRPGLALQGAHHLEQRVAAHVARGLELGDQRLERHLLVCISVQGDRALTGEQGAEVGVAGEVGA